MAIKRLKEEEAEINLTPMLDIVFIMLIFFIVTATFVKEAGLEIIKPEAETGEQKPLASILIAIGPDGDIWVENRPVDLRALQSVIEKLYAENPKGEISIQADAESPGALVVDVIEQAKNAGVHTISISTEES